MTITKNMVFLLLEVFLLLLLFNVRLGVLRCCHRGPAYLAGATPAPAAPSQPPPRPPTRPKEEVEDEAGILGFEVRDVMCEFKQGPMENKMHRIRT